MTESFLKRLQDRARELDKSATEGIVQFIPPGLRRLKPSLDFVQSMFPSTVLREAGGKTQRFFKSGGKDYKSGIGALVDTASVGIPLSVYGKLVQRETPKAIEGVTDFFMTPSVKTVDDAVDASRRDFLKKAPLAVAATAMVPPVLKEIGEVIPASGGAKVAKKVLPSSAIIAKSRALASELSDFMIESMLKKTKKAEKLSTKQLDAKTAEYNKTLSDLLKGKNYDDLIKLSKNDLADLYNQKNFSAHKGAGDPLRSKEYGPLLDKVFKDRGIGLDSQGNYKKLLRNEGDPPPKNYLEGDNFDELMTIFEKKDKRFADGGVAGLSDQARDMFKGPKGIGAYESFMIR